LNQRLDVIINDKNLAWDKTFDSKKEEFFVSIDESLINQLIEKREFLTTLDPCNFKFLEPLISTFKKMLISGSGFIIIDGTCFEKFTEEEVQMIYQIFAKFLGELYVQNIKKEKLVLIKNEGKSMKTGGRYHQTKEGGSYHTDSPQWRNVPDIIGLCCINPAKIGGTSKFVSAYTVHNLFLQKNSQLLEVLYNKFYFDKRGEIENNEEPTIFEPIMQFKDNKLLFRYLRNYIDSGHKIQNKPLTDKQESSLKLLDEILSEENIVVSYDLKKFDMTFFNNHRVVHGRTSFEDFEEEAKKRLMIRAWIKISS
jgi:hypothetical protein